MKLKTKKIRLPLFTYNLLPIEEEFSNINFYEIRRYNVLSKAYEPVGSKRIGNENAAREEVEELNKDIEMVEVEIIVEE